MKKTVRFIFSFIFIFCFFIGTARAAHAQSFKLELADPGSTINAGSSFQVKILINTAGQQAINGDALLNFDPTKVSIDSATTGNFFTYFSSTPLAGTTNQYLASSWEESVAHAKSSSSDTLFAMLTLTAKAAGSTSVSFECVSGSEADSNINKASDSTDMLTNCSGMSPLSLTIGGSDSSPSLTPTPSILPVTGASATPVPTETPTPSLTRTPTPTSSAPTAAPQVTDLPRAGTFETTLAFVGVGVVLTIVGAFFIL